MKCGLIVLALWPALAGADPLRVHMGRELPFAPAELDGALALRTQLARPGARSLEATVVTSANGVHVNVGGRERDVSLDGTQGIEAARLVAFAILDLAGDQLDPPAPATPLPSMTIEKAMPATPSIDHAPRATLALWGHGGSRTEAELELGLRVRGGLRAIVAGGASLRASIGGMVSARAWPVRAGLVWRGPHLAYGELEVKATALAVFEQAEASRSQTDAVLGGGAAVGWAAPIGGQRAGVALLVGAGVDGYANPIEYRVLGVHAADTPRMTWWAGLGIAAEVWR